MTFPKRTVRRIIGLLTVFALLLSFSSCLLSESAAFLWQCFCGDLSSEMAIPYNRMEYRRPDTADMLSRIDQAAELLTKDDAGQELIRLSAGLIDDCYSDMTTMCGLARIAYCRDTTNEAQFREYQRVTADAETIYCRLDEFYRLCAVSSYRTLLENQLFGKGFFEAYDENAGERLPEESDALLLKEAELEGEFTAAMASRSVTVDGITYRIDDMEAISDPALQRLVYDEFYDSYEKQLGSVFVELVDVRNRIAACYGYDSYADYCNRMVYERDYLPADIANYLEEIKNDMVPLLREAVTGYSETVPAISTEQLTDLSASVLSSLSEELYDMFVDMTDKQLCTIASDDTMFHNSFTLYLPSYHTPYMFVNGDGRLTDLLTVMHEFGHFSSYCLHGGGSGNIDESEVASQGLELMSLSALSSVLPKDQTDALVRYALNYQLATVVTCGCYTAFEERIYREKELTPERCTAIFAEVMDEFGLYDEYAEAREWLFVDHLFTVPFYSISYAVSADTCQQLYALCCEDDAGQGYDTYHKLVMMAGDGLDFRTHLEKAGLQYFLSAGRVSRMADFYRQQLTSG